MNIRQEIEFRRAVAKLSGQRLRKRKVPPGRPSAAARLVYQRMLTARLHELDVFLREQVSPELAAWRRQAGAERGVRLDATADDVLRVFSRFRVLFASAHPVTESTNVLGAAADAESGATAADFRAQTAAALGVELITPARGLQGLIDGWVESNLGLITSLQDGALLQVTDIVRRGVTAGIRVEAIRDEIMHAVGVTRSKAALLARDQTLKLHGQMTQERQQGAGVESYTWSTSQDERVRPRHRELNGTEHRWDDPPIVDARTGRRAHPGGDYQCRCVAIPRLEPLLEGLGA